MIHVTSRSLDILLLTHVTANHTTMADLPSSLVVGRMIDLVKAGHIEVDRQGMRVGNEWRVETYRRTAKGEALLMELEEAERLDEATGYR